MITQEYLKECLSYCPDTGVFTWLNRPRHHFATTRLQRIFSAKTSGNAAGCIGSKGYVQIKICWTTYEAQRLAWLFVHGEFPTQQIDHINGVRWFNAIRNLRSVSHMQNGMNQKQHSNNTSGITGVCWYKASRKWIARIRINGACVHLGYFDDIDDAALARRNAEIGYGFHENHGKPQNERAAQKESGSDL